MRDGYTRAREIEKAAEGLVAWVDEFVGAVYDHNGNSLTNSGEWEEVLSELREAIRPLD